MHAACAPFADAGITPMAAVAGAVADHVLAAMTPPPHTGKGLRQQRRRYCFFPGRLGKPAVRAGREPAAPALDGRFELLGEKSFARAGDVGAGLQGARRAQFSFGIADAVSVLAATAAQADAAATIVGNAVDLPGHPAVARRAAAEIDPDSDLGARKVTWDVGALTPAEIEAALDAAAGWRTLCWPRG